jgi:hypothetical protein
MSTEHNCPEDDFGILLSQLNDEEQEAAIKDAGEHFFNIRLPGLQGDYAISNMDLARHGATEEQMRQDATRFGIDPEVYQEGLWKDILMGQLEEAWDEELYDALERKVKNKLQEA